MAKLSTFVTLHPYFKVNPGKIAQFKSALPDFVDKTKAEEKNLFYGFTINGDEVFCREGYADASGVLTHLSNVAVMLAEAMKIADLIRVELHGPAGELDNCGNHSRISIPHGSLATRKCTSDIPRAASEYGATAARTNLLLPSKTINPNHL